MSEGTRSSPSPPTSLEALAHRAGITYTCPYCEKEMPALREHKCVRPKR